MIAKRIDEFTPDLVRVIDGVSWLSVNLTPCQDFEQYKNLPEICEYDGKRYYKMSYNSDVHSAYYKESLDMPYHLRYS